MGPTRRRAPARPSARAKKARFGGHDKRSSIDVVFKRVDRFFDAHPLVEACARVAVAFALLYATVAFARVTGAYERLGVEAVLMKYAMPTYVTRVVPVLRACERAFANVVAR